MDFEPMSGENEKTEGLYACLDAEQCFVRVLGRGSFKVSSNLKTFLEQSVDEKGVKSVLIDLRECVGMDSTFMGVLAGLSGRLAKKGAQVLLVNLDKKNLQLLQTLGIDKVLKYQTIEEAEARCVCGKNASAVDLSEPEEDQLGTAETMLKAHQVLADLSEENVGRFKSVISFLEQDVRKLKE
ncbi:STAS domain-containing protein [Verrucomicrobiota bacterium]